MSTLLPLPILLLIIFLLALLSFLFSASETAIIALSKIRLRHLVNQGLKRAKMVHNLLTKSDKFIAAILIGNNFVNIALSAIVTAIFVNLLGYRLGVVLSTFATAFFILIFCEITPKIFAMRYTEKIALFVAPLMGNILKILSPFTSFFSGISNFILKIFGLNVTKRSPLITEEELRLMIEVGKDEGVLSDEERRMLHKIFEFGDTKVGEVMVPNDKVVAVNVQASPEELLNIFVEQGHARLPVYEETVEKIIGVIYAHDLLYILRDKGLFVIPDLIHEPYYVTGSMRVNELLRKFQEDKIQIAIVVDAHKKALGIVTLEDLVEEIVGELEEERHPRRIKKN